MKNYYEILGIDEEATQEEIRARWAELTKLYHPDVLQSMEVDDRIKEINEAYQVLKDYSTRLEYDLERALRRSVLKKAEERKKLQRRKILLPIGVAAGVIVVVIGSFLFFLKGPQVKQEPIRIAIPPSAKVTQPESPKVVPREPVKVIVPEAKKPEERAQPVEREKPDERAKRDERKEREKRNELEKRNEREKRVEVAKVVPREPVKVIVPEAKKPVERAQPVERDERKERDKRIEVAKIVPREPVKAVVPEAKKPEERAKRDEREKPVEVAKVVPREPVKAVIPEAPKVVPPSKPDERAKRDEREKPVEVAKVVPREPVKAVVPEPPKVVPPSKPDERDERSLREEEVKNFFAAYTGKYNQRDVEGFLSFFSSRAVQNQKHRMDNIRKIYAGFFDQSQELKYQLKDLQTAPHPNGLEVKGRYELNQISKEKGEKKSWGGQARWVLVKEGGVLKILSLDYQHQK